MLGALLFRYYQNSNNELVCYYVVLSADLFSTSILDLIEDALGVVPTVFEILSGIFQDALQGIVEGLYSAAKAEDVIDKIPEFLENGLQIKTLAYLNGGNPEYIELNKDFYLKSISMTPETVFLLQTDIDSLEFYGCRAVSVTYSVELVEDDASPLDGLLVKDVHAGRYKIYYPSAADFNGANSAMGAGHIAAIDYNYNITSCICPAVGGLWGEEPTPYSPGHYLNPYAEVEFIPGQVYDGVYAYPLLQSSGINFSVPFTLSSPSANTLQARKWEKVSVYLGQNIRTDTVASPRYKYTGIGGGIMVKPSVEYIEELQGEGNRPSQLPAAVGLCLLWLLNRRKGLTV